MAKNLPSPLRTSPREENILQKLKGKFSKPTSRVPPDHQEPRISPDHQGPRISPEQQGPRIPPGHQGPRGQRGSRGSRRPHELWKPLRPPELRQPDSLRYLDLSPVEGNTFQNSRRELNRKFSKLLYSVYQRELELNRKIDEMEIEYNDEKKQKQNDKQTMLELRELTQQKLGPNTLSDVHNKIVSNIQEEIRKIDSTPNSEPVLTMDWNFDLLKDVINTIDVKMEPRRPRGEETARPITVIGSEIMTLFQTDPDTISTSTAETEPNLSYSSPALREEFDDFDV